MVGKQSNFCTPVPQGSDDSVEVTQRSGGDVTVSVSTDADEGAEVTSAPGFLTPEATDDDVLDS